jgi:hypothetical protein
VLVLEIPARLELREEEEFVYEDKVLNNIASSASLLPP